MPPAHVVTWQVLRQPYTWALGFPTRLHVHVGGEASSYVPLMLEFNRAGGLCAPEARDEIVEELRVAMRGRARGCGWTRSRV